MGFQALFLTILCFLAFHRNNPRAQGFPNITLMRKYGGYYPKDQMWCVAQGEDAFSGLSWVSTTNPYVSEREFKMNNGMKQDCNVMRGECSQWKGWDMVDSVNYPMPEVLDYRWNALTSVKSTGEDGFNENNGINIISSNDILEITLSILGKQDAYVYLCDDPSCYKHYWIIFGGWVNKFNQIRKCVNSKCKDVTERQSMSPLSDDEWVNIKVNFRKSTSELKVLFRNYQILYYQDSYNPVDVRHINVRSYMKQIVYFRYHYYLYFLASREKTLSGPYYTPNRKKVCWSIVYSIESQSQNGYLEVKLEYKNGLYQSSTQKLEYTQHQWKHKKVEFTLEEIAEVRIVITGKEGENFAVGGIMQCNPDGDTSISLQEINTYNGDPDLKCVSLKYPVTKLEFRKPSFIQDCGDDCTLNCKMFGIKGITDCKGTILCKKIGNDPNACVCSSGFTDEKCSADCYKNFYGVNCKQKCENCVSNGYASLCNAERGTCNKGCVEGYIMPFCKRTLPYLRNAPSRCTATETSITVAVDNFEKVGDGKPIKYILQYMLSSDTGKQMGWTDQGTYIYGTPGNYVINNLEPGMKYKIRAVLIDESGQTYSGQKVPNRNCTTTCDHPAEENINIKIFSRNVTVNWQVTQGNYPCQSKLYHFVVEGGGRTFSPDNENKLPFEVKGLIPYTDYTWRLSYNDVRLYSNNIKTLPDVPSKVESLEFSDINQTGVHVAWKSPKYPNGIIKFYRITYTHTNYILCPNENQSSAPEYKNVTSMSITLDNLKPYSTYVIKVEAYTIGYGEAVEQHMDTLGYGTLKVQPKFYGKNPVNIEKNKAEFSWSKPEDCSSIQGLIKGYAVLIEGKSDWVKTYRDNFTLNCNPTCISIKFERLQPYTNYTVSIVFIGMESSSDSQYALLKNFRTNPDVPGKVTNATSYSYGADWIYLRWSEPYPPTGEIEYYVVQFGAKPKQISNDVKCELWDGMICANIGAADGLKSGKQYTIQILAKNKDISSKSSPFGLTVTTEEKAPTPPVKISAVALSSQKVRVTWEHPSETRGRLKHFKLQIKSTSSGLKKQPSYDKTKTKNITHDERNYSFEIDDLPPASEYSVSVYGVTVSAGEKALTSVKTHIAAPKLGTHLQFKKYSLSDTSFQIILPAADEFLTAQSAYIIIVTSEDEMTNQKAKFMFKDEGVKQQILMAANMDDVKYSWVAAEVQPELETILFTIGDNRTQTSGGHYIQSAVNVPLVAGGRYQVTLVAVYQWGDNYSISCVKLHRPDESDEPGNPGNIVGWVILVLLLIAIPAVLFFIVKRKKLLKEGDQLELKAEDALSGNSQNDLGDENIIPDMESEEMPDEVILPPSQRFSRRVAIDDLAQYVKSGLASGELQRQHALFPRGQTRPWEYGQLPKNKSKNRYGKLAAYDDTRVILKKLPDDQFSDYINASYIDGYKSPKFYIATQGPKRNTVVDFWRMIWQENVQVIAMLANIFEDGKVKCEKYWPELGKEFTQGAVTIMNASDKIFADFTFRVLNVSSKGKTRKVHHLHFTSWPDHSVPMYPQSVASYLKKLLATPPGSGPIVVHCSAGVGRTGTIILSDICLRMAAAEGSVDMLGYLQQIREQRANLVDNLDQYKLVHLVLLECLVTEPSSYPCDASFEKRVQELLNSGAVKTQFSRLSEIRWQDQALKSASRVQIISPALSDPTKNRNLKIVPESYCRVFISPFPYDDPGSDYINAVHVDGFRVKDQFIVTQFPLESTLPDFWRLIAEKKISLIVVLNEIDNRDKSICSFWPAEAKGSIKPVPHLTVTKRHEDDAATWKIHTVSLADSGASKQVHILHLKDWKNKTKMPPSEDVMIGLWEEAERLYSGKEPIVVCCLDGATACGFFVALAFLIEKIKLEQQCDVCQAVRTVRQNREHFVPTCDQFESLYKAALTYLDSFQTYSNFS